MSMPVKMVFSSCCVFLALTVAFGESYVPPHVLQRNSASLEELIRVYFSEGYAYRLILCFLVGVHGITISLRTLKRELRKLGLRRRGRSAHTDLSRVGSATLVSLFCPTHHSLTKVCGYLPCSGSLLGYHALWQRLRIEYKLCIPRYLSKQVQYLIKCIHIQSRHYNYICL